jgi:hypothetical protein
MLAKTRTKTRKKVESSSTTPDALPHSHISTPSNRHHEYHSLYSSSLTPYSTLTHPYRPFSTPSQKARLPLVEPHQEILSGFLILLGQQHNIPQSLHTYYAVRPETKWIRNQIHLDLHENVCFCHLCLLC